MKKTKYHSPEWKEFSDRVKKRDNYNCTKCNRSSDEVVLQVHHEEYISGKKSWDYPLSSCITLCKGCHAREHGLIQPSSDWILESITDLGHLDGKCERLNCGNEIRYQYIIYHPKFGYLNVGSICVEYLTQEIAEKSRKILLIHAAIRRFLKKPWTEKTLIKGSIKFECLYLKYFSHDLYLTHYAGFSTILIFKDEKPIWQEVLLISEVAAKEIIYVVMRGIKSKSESEKKLLRDIYRSYVASNTNQDR